MGTPTYEEILERAAAVIDYRSKGYVDDCFVFARFLLALDASGRLKEHARAALAEQAEASELAEAK